MGMRIERLERKHRALCKDFQNAESSLVQYLRQFARQHDERHLLSSTFVAIDAQGGKERVAGYFSLTTVSVERSMLEQIENLEKLPNFPIPGVLLARLAVDERIQGQGVGKYLFREALGRTLNLCNEGTVRFRLFVTDAISEEAVSFYEHYGLVRLSDELPARMILDLKPLVDGRSGVSTPAETP